MTSLIVIYAMLITLLAVSAWLQSMKQSTDIKLHKPITKDELNKILSKYKDK